MCAAANTLKKQLSPVLYVLALGEKAQSVWLETLRVSLSFLFGGCARCFLLIFCWGKSSLFSFSDVKSQAAG